VRRPSPVTVSIALGLVVGVAAAAGIAATSSGKPQLPGVGPLSGQLYSSHPIDIRVRRALPSLDGSARAYRLASVPETGAIDRLAGALGVHGPVTQDGDGWVVRDGTRLLRVQRAAGLPWYLATLDGPCIIVPGERSSLGAEALPPVPPTGPTDCPGGAPSSSAGDVPAGSDATRVALEAFRHVGVADFRPVTTFPGPTSVRVVAVPVVGGLPTSRLEWTAAVAGDHVRDARGYLARPQAGDDYPLAGTDAGLDRLRRLPPAGPPVRAVTGVRLGLLHAGDWLVPAYLFDLEGGGVAAVPAVEDRYLA
jgi:hypothetical protein